MAADVEFEHHASRLKSAKKHPFCYSCGPNGRKPRLPNPRPKTPPDADRNDNLDKNFVAKNAITIIKAAPKVVPPKMIDTRVGTIWNLEDSGLLPKYIKKRSYGKIPRYLEKRKEEMKESQEMFNMYVAAQVKQASMEQLSREEKSQLLQGLQDNYDYLNHQYLTMSLVMDSCTKRCKKDSLESQLLELDKYIKILQSHATIFITPH